MRWAAQIDSKVWRQICRAGALVEGEAVWVKGQAIAWFTPCFHICVVIIVTIVVKIRYETTVLMISDDL